MTDTTVDTVEDEKKGSKLPLLLAVVAVLVGVGGGFFATYNGLLLGADSASEPAQEVGTDARLDDVAFVEIDPIVVSIGDVLGATHLRFRAQLEVPAQYADDVTSVMPRVVDVLNGYLRALEKRDLENSAALTRLRAQMLRRVQVVAGSDRVKDLLIMEFVLN